MTTLTELKLNLDFNYIKNEGAEYVSQALKSLVNLKYLYLSVALKNFGPLGFEYLAASIATLTKMEDLTIICGVNRIGGESV